MSDELKAKVERIGRERVFRERDPDRGGNRRENLNGHAEEGRSKFRNRRDSGAEGDRLQVKTRQRQGDEVDDDAVTPKRSAFSEKINKPWFREANEQFTDGLLGEKPSHASVYVPRDKENHHAKKMSWLGGANSMDNEPEPRTQQDFAAWKEAMKKEQGEKSSVSKLQGGQGFGLEQDREGSQPNTPTANPPLFGLWGQSEDEQKKPEEAKKAGKPAKVSRFFGAGAQKAAAEPAPPEMPKSPASPASPEDDENRKGFQNIMQMLRAGGGNPPDPADTGSSPQAMQLPLHHKNPTPPTNAHAQNVEQLRHSPYGTRGSESSPTQTPTNRTPPKHQTPSRDAEFFVNLLKQQRQRPRFQEGQIYGQNYDQRREPEDIASLINDVMPYQAKQTHPPPGFYDNQQAFAANNAVDLSDRLPPMDKPPQEHFPPQNMRESESHLQGPHLPDFRFPPRPQIDFGGPPPGPHARPPSHENIAPPPGFPSSRPNAPPGFPLYGPSQGGPPQMRGPPPMHFNGHPPPGFGPQAPPGINPPSGGRRMPSQNVPPGFEMYGDMSRRPGAPPMPPTSSYAQYVKQGGGPAAYQGI